MKSGLRGSGRIRAFPWPGLAGALSVFAVWEAAVRGFRIAGWLLPAPSRVIAELVLERAVLGLHSVRTLTEAVIGLLLAVIFGVALGTLVCRVALLRRALYPLLVLTQTIPLVVLAPLLVIWFGYGLFPKIIVVVLACFFPVAVNTVTGLESADPDLIRLFHSMGATRHQIFRMIRWPSAIPSVLSGARVAAGYAVMAAVVGEWMGSDRGLGVYIVRSAHSFLTSRVFAGIVLVSLYSIALFAAVEALERRVVFWRES